MNNSERYSYPRTNENGSTDWSPTVAVAILLQMVLNGSVSPLDLAGPESEPEVGQEKIIDVIRREDPVFTAATLHQKLTQRPMRNVTNVLEVVADTLKLPSAAFTSRAYRSISDALISRSLCDVGGTSISWRCAIFENSPWARIDKYRHETELPNENVPKKNRKELIRAINLNNWVSAPVKAFNPEEPDPSAKETKFNLIKAIRQVIVMKRSESPTEVLGGQMVCPVVDCPIEAKDYIGKFDEHWFQVHEERKNELKYRCAQCINGQTCSFKSYSAHRSKRHPVESPVFRWVYDE
uniref:Uncharacterized protein n=1 Tax=Caenorhabditis japonica TaxID=281687 RepID=A0A8R1DNA9_CAEJA